MACFEKRLLDGSVQLIGRSMFVSNFYSFTRVQEFFGEMAKVKEDCKIISTDKGETFTFPFYVTKPSLLTFPNEHETGESKSNFNWKGKLPKIVSASFIGLFCSLQHLARVKIIWKCVETGQIGVNESEIVFKVLSNPKYLNPSIILGVLKDLKVPEKDLDEIFPDDLIIEDMNELLEEINYLKSNVIDDEEDVDEIVRSIVESDFGYNRSISAEIDGASLNIGTIYLRKTFLNPGTQIFITIDLNLLSKIDLIKFKLDCIETYPAEMVLVSSDRREWRDTVKEMKISPGCQDRLEVIFPLSPELISSISCSLFDLKWELSVNFKVHENDFDLKIPLNFISFKFELNKKY
jgi:hypothetical protein